MTRNTLPPTGQRCCCARRCPGRSPSALPRRARSWHGSALARSWSRLFPWASAPLPWAMRLRVYSTPAPSGRRPTISWKPTSPAQPSCSPAACTGTSPPATAPPRRFVIGPLPEASWSSCPWSTCRASVRRHATCPPSARTRTSATPTATSPAKASPMSRRRLHVRRSGHSPGRSSPTGPSTSTRATTSISPTRSPWAPASSIGVATSSAAWPARPSRPSTPPSRTPSGASFDSTVGR